MAPKKGTFNKTQQLTMRIDDKTRFQLDFSARITGMSITTFVERAILEKSNDVRVWENVPNHEPLNWVDFWDTDEGMRTIRMLADIIHTGIYTTFEEDQLITFVRSHWNFFAEDPNLSKLSRDHVNIIWPHMSNLLEIWMENRANDPECAAKKLLQLLKAVGLKQFEEDKIPF